MSGRLGRERRTRAFGLALVAALVLAGAGCTDSDDEDQGAPETSETKALEDAQKAHLDRFGA